MDDQRGAPTSSLFLAEATARALSAIPREGVASGIYHLSAAGETTWAGFARAIFERARTRPGFRVPRVVPIATSAYPTPARRPRYSVLSHRKFAAAFGFAPSAWEAQLDACFARLAPPEARRGEGTPAVIRRSHGVREVPVGYNFSPMSAVPVESQPRRLGEILIARGKLDLREPRARAAPAGGRVAREARRHPRAGSGSSPRATSRTRFPSGWGLRSPAAAEYPELPLLEEQVSDRFLREREGAAAARDGRRHRRRDGRSRPTSTRSARSRWRAASRVLPRLAVVTELEAALERLYGAGKSSMGQIVDDIATRDEEQDLGDIEHLKDLASEAPVIRLVNLLITHALESAGLRHPHRALREPAHRALPHRRRPERGGIAAAPPFRRRHLAREDHGEPGHRRAPAAAGRAHQAAHPGQGDRPARLHRADDARRKRGDAHPRQGRRAARLRLPRLRRQGSSRSSSRRSASRTASSS